eukprot:Skav202086  [mRNA]  locus=scaffold513:138255:140293:- [translate_table: standard]
MVTPTCDEQRARLSLRLDLDFVWFQHIDAAIDAARCPDVQDSIAMAEISALLWKMLRYRTRGRFNATNQTSYKSLWRHHVRRTMRHLAKAEKMLEALLLKNSLYDYFHPSHLGTAIFFHAANLVRSLQRFLPSLFYGNLRTPQKLVDPIWRSLESTLHHDGPINLLPPESECSMLSVLPDLLRVDDLRIQAGSDWSGALGREIKQSLDSAQQQLFCMHKNGGRFLKHFTFPKAFVFFQLLDRLDCRKVRAIKLLGDDFDLWRHQTFWMHLVPARHIESDHVRGKGEFHCGWSRSIEEPGLQPSQGQEE